MYKVVRDNMVVWPYCPTCGCRLAIHDNEDYIDEKPTLSHYQAHWHRNEDAQGHNCEFVNEIITLDNLDDIFRGVSG